MCLCVWREPNGEHTTRYTSPKGMVQPSFLGEEVVVLAGLERERERKDGRHSRTPVQKAEPDRERCGKLIWPLAEIERETERQSQTERKERTEERAKGHPTIGFKLQMKHFSLSLCFCQQKPTKLQTFLLFLLLLLSLSVPVLRRSVPVSRSRSRSEH